MSALEQAEALRQEAISLLLSERQQIDTELEQLGYDGQEKAAFKKRGRPRKADVARPAIENQVESQQEEQRH